MEALNEYPKLICIKSDMPWFTEGEVYTPDEEGKYWDEPSKAGNQCSWFYTELVPNSTGQGDFEIYDELSEELSTNTSDGSTASYYELPEASTELQDLISYKNMNAQVGEIFRECYRYAEASHCDELRGIKKILFYANAELKRLEARPNVTT